MDNPKKIAVFLPNPVGDVVMATPALRALRQNLPDSRIVYVGRRAAIDTLTGTTWADAMITDPAGRKGGLMAMLRLAARLRHERFDLAILMPGSTRSALQALLGGCRDRAGYSRGGRTFLLSRVIDPPRDSMGLAPVPMIDYYNRLLTLVDIQTQDRRMELPTLPSDEMAAEVILQHAKADAARPIVMINAAAAFGTSKFWHFRRYAELADALTDQRGAQIILNAAPGEQRVVAQVAACMKHAPLINFAERPNSLGLVKALLRRCRLLVTNDTGARHIGAAVGIGVVTIFGSTDPERTVIYYDRERIVRASVTCSPCQKQICTQPPGPRYHQCMTAITVEQVLAAALELMDAEKPA